MKITPQWATSRLAHTEKNIAAGLFRQRPIYDGTVERYSRDILLGRWLANPQTISFDVDGNCIDGRHRLRAVERTGVAVILNVSTGWPLSQSDNGHIALNTIDVIDRGKLRSISGQLAVHGIPNARYRAAVAKCITEICCDGPTTFISYPQTVLILELYQKSIEEIEALLTSPRRRVSYIGGPITFVHAGSRSTASEFAFRYNSLIDLPKGSPVLALVNWVGNHPRCSTAGDRPTTYKVALSCLRAFDANEKMMKVYSSQDAWRWATSKQKDNVRKVREIMGVK